MTRGIPSLDYLKTLSTALLVYHEKYEKPQRLGEGVDTEKMKEAWDAIIELAEEIRDCVVPKKGKRGAKTEERSAAESVRPTAEAESEATEGARPGEEDGSSDKSRGGQGS
jgi:hypothetical protein